MAEYIKKEDIEQKIQDGLNNLVLGHDAIEVLGMIYEMPSEDVAPVLHGRWNRPYISWFLPMKIKNPHCFCTNCAYPMKHKKVTRYCPNCGAKMME